MDRWVRNRVEDFERWKRVAAEVRARRHFLTR